MYVYENFIMHESKSMSSWFDTVISWFLPWNFHNYNVWSIRSVDKEEIYVEN